MYLATLLGAAAVLASSAMASTICNPGEVAVGTLTLCDSDGPYQNGCGQMTGMVLANDCGTIAQATGTGNGFCGTTWTDNVQVTCATNGYVDYVGTPGGPFGYCYVPSYGANPCGGFHLESVLAINYCCKPE